MCVCVCSDVCMDACVWGAQGTERVDMHTIET